MKYIYSIIICFVLMLLCVGCSSRHFKELSLNDVKLEQATFRELNLDSTKILDPRGFFYFNNHLVFIEPKNDPTLSFWTADSLKYEFSSGYKGGGPNELIHPRGNYFASSDSSFFILDSNIEREIIIENQNIRIVNNVGIAIPDAINQLVRLDNDYYIMSGNTNGSSGKEHFIYSDGTATPFGDYPSKNLEQEEQARLDHKCTAGRMGKKVIFDFYIYHNLIRKYSMAGELLQEIRLKDIPERHNTLEKLRERIATPFWFPAVAMDDAIYVLFYQGVTDEQIYAKGVIPELQVWDWDGNLKNRFLFDKVYDKFTVSPNGILYAANREKPYKIYTYDISR